jgi:hypothetical protein
MATLIFQAIGSAIAGPIGAAIGAIAGTAIDRAIIGGPNIQREGPRLTDLTVQNSSYGEALPLTYGTVRIAGNIIWSSGLIERRSEETQGGKSGSVTTTSYSYFASFAVALTGHEIGDIKRIWADGKLLRTSDGTLLPAGQMRIYLGTEDQMPDALIEAAVGLDYAPAHRGAAYVVFEELALADFANRIPNLTFEIEAVAGQASADLDAILVDVLARCDVRQRAVASRLVSVPGFVVAREASGRSVFEALAPILPLALSDSDGTILISPIAYNVAKHVFDAQRLGAQAGSGSSDQKADERLLEPAATLPGELQLRYSDPLRDYQINMQRSRRFAARTNVRQTIDIPAVLDADRAKQMAEQILARQWRERQKRQIRLPLSHIIVRPGDSVSFSDQPQGIWLAQSIALEDGGLTIGLLPLSSTDLVSAAVADSGGMTGQNPAPHGPSQGYLLDLPPIETLLPTVPRLFVVAAGGSRGWRRASFWLSSNQGQSYAQVASISRATVLGTTTTSLSSAAAGIWDETSQIEVELLNGDMQLLSRPHAAILAGGNLALIGSELIHFRVATAVTAQRYRLSGLLRGVRGTEAFIGNHSIGEPFILLDPLPDVLALPPLAAIDQSISGKFLSPGQGLGDVPAQSILLRGYGLRPLSPVHGQQKILSNGDRSFSWIRRSRSGFDWLDGIDAPLAETSEQYRLTIKVGASVRRTIDVAEPSWTYLASLQASDGVGPGVGHAEIAQLSATIGAGAPLRLNF